LEIGSHKDDWWILACLHNRSNKTVNEPK
jgi:hypothetical protein